MIVAVLSSTLNPLSGVRNGKPQSRGRECACPPMVIWTEQGRSPYEIVSDFPQLTLADVYAALTYYHDHQADIDRQIKQAEDFAAAMQAEQSSEPHVNAAGKDADANPLPS